MTDTRRVLALWALILAVFLAFNAVYWPVHSYQADQDPDNFMVYAQKLHAQGQSAAAMDVLRQGIAAHHPTAPEPYEQLQGWLADAGKAAESAKLNPTVTFYRALGASGHAREVALRGAVDSSLALFPLPSIAKDSAGTLRLFAGNLGASLGVREAVRGLNEQQQYALLRLSGGVVSTNGEVGNTGVKLTFDLLVQSSGSADGRIAHIFLRGRDLSTSERGIHVAVLDPESSQVLQLGVYDIWSSPKEAERMARMLESMPQGSVAAFAVLDDASANMTDDLETQLRGFGLLPEAIIQRRARFYGLRYSFAAIGVKGAIPGKAMQAWSPDAYEGAPGHPVVCAVLNGETRQ